MNTLEQPTVATPPPTAIQSAVDFIDEPEALNRLPVSRRTLANWRTEGKIPYIKAGKRVLFHWPSVEAALLRTQRGATATA